MYRRTVGKAEKSADKIKTAMGKLKPVAAMVTGAGAALGAAPTATAAIGFTANGITSGSAAASIMSVLGGAATPAGGVVAAAQAIGATGMVASAPAAAVIGIGVAGAAVGYIGYRGVKSIFHKKKGIDQAKHHSLE